MNYSKPLFLLLVFLCGVVQAQFLPNNTTLNVQSVQRWMESNRDFKPILEVLDGLHVSDADLKQFDSLPAVDQDKKITEFLNDKKYLDTATSIATRHGWKSVGEYMRLSTKLGNAIAAYFLVGETQNLSTKQKKQVRDKTDPSVLSVPQEDIAFVNANEKLLKQYIQAYGKSR
jgi:hypothetical protein